MELLGILESRVGSLVAEIKFLREENTKLRANAGGRTAPKAENSHLKRALVEEQHKNATTLKHLEGVLALTDLVHNKR